MPHQLSLLRVRTFSQNVLRIGLEIGVFVRRSGIFSQHGTLKFIKPPQLSFEARLHFQLVVIQMVEEIDYLLNEQLLFEIPTLTVAIS